MNQYVKVTYHALERSQEESTQQNKPFRVISQGLAGARSVLSLPITLIFRPSVCPAVEEPAKICSDISILIPNRAGSKLDDRFSNTQIAKPSGISQCVNNCDHDPARYGTSIQF